MVRIALLLTIVAALTGCYAAYPIKMAVDKVCDATDAEKAVLAEKFDAATMPHAVRVRCDVYKADDGVDTQEKVLNVQE